MQNRTIYYSLLIGVLLISLVSCYSESKLSTYEYNPEAIETNPDSCRVIFFNASHEEFYSLIGIIDIRINNHYPGKLPINDSISVTVPKGPNKLFLEHLDVRFFSTEHDIMIENDINYIMVKTRPFWHSTKLYDSPPKKFKKIFILKSWRVA